MNLSFTELTAIFVSSLVMLLTVNAAGGKRFAGRKQTVITLLAAAATAAVTAAAEVFIAIYFVTPVVMLAVTVFAASKLTSKGGLLIRSLSGVLAVLVIQTLDHIFAVSIGYLFGNPEDIFELIFFHGPIRITLLFFARLFDVVLYLILRDRLKALRDYPNSLKAGLLVMGVIAYAFTEYLINVLIYPRVGAIHLAIVLIWCFVLAFIGVVLSLVSAMSKAEKERQERAHLRSTNMLMAKNYRNIQSDRTEYARKLHDFNHHLTAIRSLSHNGKNDEIESYIESLLSTGYKEIALCHSGSDIVDAIINCKAAEAKDAGISFAWKAELSHADVDPADICAILANQIDNAFEACMKVEDPKERFVEVNIWQKTSNMAFFRVTNSVAENPFGNDGGLHSEKSEESSPHGLGVKNIRETAEKYSGSLQNTYQDGQFTSTVFLCYKQSE